MISTKVKNKNHPLLHQLAKNLRNQSSLSETLLWNRLKGGKLYGYTFQRQKAIGSYLVDFYCHELRLIIEIDNKGHHLKDCRLYDIRRRLELQECGYQLLHYDDDRVKKDLGGILFEIELYIMEFQEKSPSFMEEQPEYLLELV